ncbi:MAG: prepilin-type N-terminal cleavage/methylation domain-containing protein [Patescibacteria group bacterium]
MSSDNKKPTIGFTLIELIIGITIVGVLATMGTVVYSNSMATSRDARRRSDLEQIRSALELFRSNSGTSLYPTNVLSITPYIKIPKDTRNNKDYGYIWTSPGNDYTLGVYLESPGSSTCGVVPVPTICWNFKATPSPIACNYCVGPYGTK